MRQSARPFRGARSSGDIAIDRRSFLAGLLALGATVRLSSPLAASSPAEIDDAWQDLLENPWILKVSDRTIVDPSVAEPRVWRDVFDDIDGWDPVSEIEGCPPLLSFIQSRIEEEVAPIAKSLRRHNARAAAPSRRLQRLAERLDDEDEAWKAWLQSGGPGAEAHVKRLINEWLDDPVDWSQSEWFPVDSGSQGEVYRYFLSMDPDICDELGVVIVEGDHPGSTYFAAELHASLADANRAAAKLGLPFRFA